VTRLSSADFFSVTSGRYQRRRRADQLLHQQALLLFGLCQGCLRQLRQRLHQLRRAAGQFPSNQPKRMKLLLR
jgi:hypothetical protein